MSEEDLLRQIFSAEGKRQPKRKVESQSSGSYHSRIMTKVEMLAKALRGKVIEDQGYRGIIQLEEGGEFVRYHSVHGVHVVERLPRTWRVKRVILSPSEIRPFLEESGLLMKLEPLEKPLDTLRNLFDGEVMASFQTGGGVLKLPEGAYLRFANIQGLDIVEFVVTKWRLVKHIAGRNEVLKDLIEDKQRVVVKVAKCLKEATG